MAGFVEAIKDSEWRPLYEKAFAVKKSDKPTVEIEPQETLNILIQLSQMLYGELEPFQAWVRKETKELAILGDVSEEKCDLFYNTFEDIEQKFKENRFFHNLKKYLEFVRQQQLDICKESYLKLLKKTVEGLDEKEREVTERLKQSIVEANEGALERPILDPSKEALERGIVKYINSISETNIGAESRAADYEESVGAICKSVREKLKYALRPYYFYAKNKEVLNQFDPYAKGWLENIKICWHNLDMEEGYKRAFRKLEQAGNEKKQKNCIKGFLNTCLKS